MAEPIRLKDSEDIKHVIVEIDLKNNRTRIMSGLAPWGNIKVMASCIGVSYRKLLADGENPITTYKMLERVIVEMLDTDYDITDNEKEIKNDKGNDIAGSGSKTESVGIKSSKVERVTNHQQPIGKNYHKPQEEDKKSIKSKNKNKRAN